MKTAFEALTTEAIEVMAVGYYKKRYDKKEDPCIDGSDVEYEAYSDGFIAALRTVEDYRELDEHYDFGIYAMAALAGCSALLKIWHIYSDFPYGAGFKMFKQGWDDCLEYCVNIS